MVESAKGTRYGLHNRLLGERLVMRQPTILAATAITLLSLAGCAQDLTSGTAPKSAVKAAALSPAQKIHNDLVALDTHLDTPMLLERHGFDITERHTTAYDFSQVDVPRMREGGLDGGFWVIYTRQGPLTTAGYQAARNGALLRATAIHKMLAAHPQHFEIATEPGDAGRITKDGKIVVYLSIENSYPLGEDITLLETFYDYGVRMVGPVHNANNQFADSSTDKNGPQWGGLSPLGEALVKEANRLGMIVDASHAHDLAFDDMLALSKTPIILSHSGALDVYGHPRNIDDERLKKLAASGGVIHMNALGAYLKKLQSTPERTQAYRKLFKDMAAQDMSDHEVMDALLQRRREIDAKYPPVMADFEDYMTHFLHVLKLIGPEHVGVGADWDGGGGVNGMNDVAAVDEITIRLLAEGYSPNDIAKIWSGNVLRLLKTAQEYAAGL